ncbi:DNA cytosine methyltransferase [Caldimonas tepidiphila]|uniref:DNA cytosine methyltransferase n=1 Tax=Caldimonas tepidiphila TaxID=2315841 RepID=UPI0014758926|nr:DNA cytosine methyltransferase [Caldimonas tepidiphila]
MSVPVIDLFAGPGGLGEGLSRSNSADFKVVVSIEKDAMAFETLRLRAAHRALLKGANTPESWQTWDEILGREHWSEVFEKLRNCKDPGIRSACEMAAEEAWHFELGSHNRETVSKGIRQRLQPFLVKGKLPRNIVLIGGPPCQAYSLVGRARNRGKEGYRPEEDHRHFLYLEYLRVINEFKPAVFVMENVKGILTSTIEGKQLFATITEDLRRPDRACGTPEMLEYVLVALPNGAEGWFPPHPDAEDFIVRAETHGIPQARHRVIICGVRRDVYEDAKNMVGRLQPAPVTSVAQVIHGLPRLRPEVSYRGRGLSWLDSFSLPLMEKALQELRSRPGEQGRKVAVAMENRLRAMQQQDDPGRGKDRHPLPNFPAPKVRPEWYADRPLTLLTNHESRSHMPEDLVRYLFVACFGEVAETSSPRLADFPPCLLPRHKNVDPNNISAAIFKDRFRVQLAGAPSMTVTSHIAKDGHAFIHPDSTQCRSLTVREAARLQTFPDSYVFLGNRTSQYTQVGNAVPPLLAYQIGELVGDVLHRAGLASALPSSPHQLVDATC